jgi:DNA-binding winged helix-turn-helix (wHTH) protein
MNFSASPQQSRDLSLSASPSESSVGRGEALSSKVRRNGQGRADAPLARVRFGRFELDEAEARLTYTGVPIAIAPKPFAVLCALARAHGKLLTKSALRELVWGHQFVTDAVLKSTISELRAALSDDPKEPKYIETVWRHGYRFIADAVSSPVEPAAPVERKVVSGTEHPARAALMALCRGDAALADLIRVVAATLERDAALTGFGPNADGSLTQSQ